MYLLCYLVLFTIYSQNSASIQPRTILSKFTKNQPTVRIKVRKNIGPARRLDARGPRRRSAAAPVVPALNQRRPLTVDLGTVGPGKPSLIEANVDRAQALPAEKSTFTTALDTTLMLSLRDSLSERICHMIL